MKLGIKAFIFLIIPIFGYSQISDFTNEFLKIPASAKAIGLGNAVYTQSEDASAVFFNASLLPNLTNNFNLTITHSNYFNNMANYDFVSFATSKNDIFFGIAFINFAVDKIPNTLNVVNGNLIDLSQITYFSITDNALLLSFGKKANKFNYGFTSKLIYRNFGPFAKGYGFGLDFSLFYKWKKLKLAFIARDITSTFTFWHYTLDSTVINVFQNTGNEIPRDGFEITPPSFILAIGKDFKLKNAILKTELNTEIFVNGRTNFLLSTDVISINPQIGAELSFKNLFFRLGFNNLQKVEFFIDSTTTTKNFVNVYPNFGLGFHYKSIYFSYSVQNFLNQKANFQSQFFTIRFEKQIKKQKVLTIK